MGFFRTNFTCLYLGFFLLGTQPLLAQIGTVYNHQKIAESTGGFTSNLDINDQFGTGLEQIGDFDGDGIIDLLVGSIFDDDGGTNRGAAYILYMNANGTVKAERKISSTQGGFTGTLLNDEIFGSSVASIGDHDGDGVTDFVIGQQRNSDGGFWNGAVWVLFMNANGTVKSHQKISDTVGGFTGAYTGQCGFGGDVAFLGDLDGDGIGDIAVGARRYNDAGSEKGTVWILFLNANGTVKSHERIGYLQGGFTGVLDTGDAFGSVENIGDLDGDGVVDLVIGALGDDDGGTDKGAAWIVFLNTNGTAKASQKISDLQGGFTGSLSIGGRFGVWGGPPVTWMVTTLMMC